MADGVPVALIVPVTVWRLQRSGSQLRTTAARTGALLAIPGLGYGAICMPTSKIDTAIDAGLPDANGVARHIADESYIVPQRQRKK